MINPNDIFSGFAVSDLEKAKKFYGQTLGLEITDTPQGLKLHIGGGSGVFIYPKADHVPATYTILNFPVDNIDETVDDLAQKSVVFEQYDSLPTQQDNKGILRGIANGHGPDIAWFKDPSGNTLSVLQVQ